MEVGSVLSGSHVPACVYLQTLRGLPGESDNKLASTRAARHIRLEQFFNRTAEACSCLRRIFFSLFTGPHKERHSNVARVDHSMPGAALARDEREAGWNPRPRSFTVKPTLFVKGSFVLALICSVQFAACVRHLGDDQRAWPDAPQVHSSTEVLRAEAISLMRHQFTQLERQKVLEADAEPSLSSPCSSTTKSSVMLQLAGSVATAAETPSEGVLSSSDSLGAILVGDADGRRAMEMTTQKELDVRGGVMTAESGPYSFLNWGQIGGMMQSPALAHTGMPVYVPRQVVGTTVGLDFDSPATFHGPLLVLLMVCILIFFIVLLLCCWLVRSKQKHDKFMAEKLPR